MMARMLVRYLEDISRLTQPAVLVYCLLTNSEKQMSVLDCMKYWGYFYLSAIKTDLPCRRAFALYDFF